MSSLTIRPASLNSLVLEVQDAQTEEVCRQLLEKVSQAPQMFQDTGVILSLEKLTEEQGPIDLERLVQTLQQARLHILGVACDRSCDSDAVQSLGLLRLPATRFHQKRAQEPLPPAIRRPVVIHSPVRAGQQIYAEGTDLVITATVSAGAEILADGHIHVYGPLRGRALAGVQGDTAAQIFCRQLDAELVSIAGHYLIAESLAEHPLAQQSVQISLHETQLHIEPL